MPPVDAFSPVYQQFAAVTGTWYGTLFDYANQLFLMLATIEIGLGAIQWMVAQQSHDYVAMGLFRKILWIGFVCRALNAQTWIPAVISSFVQAGREASGILGLNPAEIFIEGLGLTGSLLATLSNLVFFWKAPAIAASLFAAVVVFFSFCFIAIQMALALVEAYIVTGGAFPLRFGAMEQSRPERYSPM
jgi:type IV secretion system protein TrbL